MAYKVHQNSFIYFASLLLHLSNTNISTIHLKYIRLFEYELQKKPVNEKSGGYCLIICYCFVENSIFKIVQSYLQNTNMSLSFCPHSKTYLVFSE